jgi:hypothetical protein
MFVALKNWRQRLKHRHGEAGRRLLADAERALRDDSESPDLLRHFRAAALAPDLTSDDLPELGELGPQFAGAEPLSRAQNLSIMASVQRGAARRTRRR